MKLRKHKNLSAYLQPDWSRGPLQLDEWDILGFWQDRRSIPLSPGRGESRRCDPQSPLPVPKPGGTLFCPVSVRRRRRSLTGIFWAYSLPFGVSIPDVWHFRAGLPSSLSRGGKCFSYGGRSPKRAPRGTATPLHPPAFSPVCPQGSASPAPRRRGRPGTHQLGVERRGEAVDPARVPDHPVEEIGHGQGVTADVPRSADQQPQQPQHRNRTCGEGGGVGARNVGVRNVAVCPRPARPSVRPLTCRGQSHGAAEPVPGTERLRSAGEAPASPIYAGIARRWRVSPLTCAARGHREPARPERRSRLGGRTGASLAPAGPTALATHRGRPKRDWLLGSVLGLYRPPQPVTALSWAERGGPAQKWRGQVRPSAFEGVRVGERRLGK